jgi:hypothetical protein
MLAKQRQSYALPVGMIFDSRQAYSGRVYRDAMAAAHSHVACGHPASMTLETLLDSRSDDLSNRSLRRDQDRCGRLAGHDPFMPVRAGRVSNERRHARWVRS